MAKKELTHNKPIYLPSNPLVDGGELLLAEVDERLRENDAEALVVIVSLREVVLVLDVLIVAIGLLEVGHYWREEVQKGGKSEGSKGRNEGESQRCSDPDASKLKEGGLELT